MQQNDVDAPILKRFRLAQRVELEQREAHARQVRTKEAQDVGEDPRVRRRLDEADAQSSRLAACRALRRALRALRLREGESRFFTTRARVRGGGAGASGGDIAAS